MSSSVGVNESHERLMRAIGDTIASHTQASPMSIDEIVGVLGFCAGAAIVRGCHSPNIRRQMRSVTINNVDGGMEFMRRATSGSVLILQAAG